MRSVVLEQHGAVDQLKVKEQEGNQILKPDEIRVQVEYCALNHLDLWLRKGGTGDRLDLPRIPGSDIAGFVSDIGTEITHLHPGDPVLIYPGTACGQCSSCLHGKESMCAEFRVVGYNTDGGYTESINVKANHVIKIPDDNLNQWAAVPVTYITAWNALVTKAKISAKDTVAIWGASGGLGYAAASIAKGFGARVICIVGSEDKARFLLEQGFEEVIIRSDEIVKDIRFNTNNNGVDVVLDHVGKHTWKYSLKMLKKGGRLAFCGVTTGPKAETDLRYIFAKQLAIYGSWMGDRADFDEVVQFLKPRPDLLPYVYQTYPLEDVGKAQHALEHGKHTGKILLKVSK